MTSASKIRETERTLLRYLGDSLNTSDGGCTISDLAAEEWKRIYALADRHEVLVLLGNRLNPNSLPPQLQEDFQSKTARTVHKGIVLQALTTRLTALFSKEGITAVTLKGYAVARLYPVPEFRKTTDADFFFDSNDDAVKAGQILCENGFRFSKEWHANHHFVLISGKNETVELHTAWADAFKDKHLNTYLKGLQIESMAHCVLITVSGARLYVYDTAYQAFYLAIHMLSHFVGEGFGLRNLCDWVVLWENCGDENARKAFCQMACDSGIVKFAKAVTAVFTEYLGL